MKQIRSNILRGGKVIEVLINLEIIFFIIIFIFTNQIKIYAIFILFAFIHELSHLVVGLILGFRIRKIMMMPFGFKIIFKKDKDENETKNIKKSQLKKMVVDIAGPVSNIIIMIIGLVFHLHFDIIYSNLIIAIFNLIPIYPLDGGRIINSFLNIKTDKIKAYKITNRISNMSIIAVSILTSVLILYVKNIAIGFAVAYLWYVVIRENKKYKLLCKMYYIIENNN